MWGNLKVATFAIPQSHSVDCKAERFGREGAAMTPRLFRQRIGVGRRPSPEMVAVRLLEGGNQSFDCWNVWHSMLASKTPVAFFRLYLCAARRHTPDMICSDRLPLMVSTLSHRPPCSGSDETGERLCNGFARTVQSTVSVTSLVNGYA